MIGPPGGDLVARSASSAELFRLPHRLLSATEIRRLYPAFRIEDNWVALWERDAGYLRPEACIEQQLRLSVLAGAELHFDEPVTGWNVLPGEGVTVRSSRRTYSADQLVISTGPWAPQVLFDLQLPLSVTRQVVFWFEPASHVDLFRPERFPIFIRTMETDRPFLYGFPLTGPDSEGVKVGLHGSRDFCAPETIDRTIHSEDERVIRENLVQALPSLSGRLVHAEIATIILIGFNFCFIPFVIDLAVRRELAASRHKRRSRFEV
jgi:sarcosine oxidase